ncbi:hypothetical protein C8F04DRAFT_1179255 [Mycena alexandri]|uniref:Uncharacterized protein n=1 Tax=Mycena alexandri TaxID=1745969 RepID=A0AAD6XB88_9AGAR|nr:hypothetical protein C8F04DRAFT_1179255 [Mycena alexandri]
MWLLLLSIVSKDTVSTAAHHRRGYLAGSRSGGQSRSGRSLTRVGGLSSENAPEVVAGETTVGAGGLIVGGASGVVTETAAATGTEPDEVCTGLEMGKSSSEPSPKGEKGCRCLQGSKWAGMRKKPVIETRLRVGEAGQMREHRDRVIESKRCDPGCSWRSHLVPIPSKESELTDLMVSGTTLLSLHVMATHLPPLLRKKQRAVRPSGRGGEEKGGTDTTTTTLGNAFKHEAASASVGLGVIDHVLICQKALRGDGVKTLV